MKKESKAGRPKLDDPKRHVSFRLKSSVIAFIKSQDNQVAYIERLVLADQLTQLKP